MGLAGRAILPPYWAFAPWMGRDFHQSVAQVLEDVDKMRALGTAGERDPDRFAVDDVL